MQNKAVTFSSTPICFTKAVTAVAMELKASLYTLKLKSDTDANDQNYFEPCVKSLSYITDDHQTHLCTSSASFSHHVFIFCVHHHTET